MALAGRSLWWRSVPGRAQRPSLRGTWLVALLLACAGSYAPTAVTPTQENLEWASRVLSEAAERRNDVRLDEGGLVLLAHTYEWREVDVYRDLDRGILNERGLPDEGILSDRVPVGPRRFHITPENLKEVRIQPYLTGFSLELVLEGAPEPIFLARDDAAEAERMGEALDLLRRAGASPALEAAPAP